MRILFIGDVFGQAGRKAVESILPKLRQREKIDFVIANAENIAHGKGISPSTVKSLYESGVDVITTGNHAFDREESLALYQQDKRILRPANFSKKCPGSGLGIYEVYSGVTVGVINLIGRVHMAPANCPFEKVDEILMETKTSCDIVIVDMHAEASSESRAMGWYLDGRVGAVVGSHTHVPTADEEVLPKGTAYITDAGMTGPYRSIIGIEIEVALNRFLMGMRSPIQPAKEDIRMYSVLMDIEESNGRARSIQRLCEKLNDSV
ncbi:MAG: TIGR00282 family metallophosphoesterase [Deltaproteobacteria bacterium]|nr:TIGR00282 family metallophosphoesterase [Deltaproteobacteria bacterium]